MLKMLLLVAAPVILRGQLLTPVWIEVGEGGKIIARVVVTAASDCPVLRVDGTAAPMLLRGPAPAGLRPACEVIIPGGAKSATAGSQSLALPPGGSIPRRGYRRHGLPH